MVRGRADGRTLIDRPRGEGQPDDRPHAAARALPRPAPGRGRAAGARGLPRSLPGHRRPGHRDRAGDARRRARRRSTSSSCSPSRSCASPTAGGPSPEDAMTDACPMRAWRVAAPGADRRAPTRARRAGRSRSPGPARSASACTACGVCRTDLHLAEGDLAAEARRRRPRSRDRRHRRRARRRRANASRVGDRVGIPWLAPHVRASAGGAAAARRTSASRPQFTGWDADGGYAQYAVVDEATPTRCPIATTTSTPRRCCARASSGTARCERAELPPGGRLGIYGFGASAHLVAQVAMKQGATVHVLTRSETAQRLALDLGAASAGPADARPPEPLDAAILFAPAGSSYPSRSKHSIGAARSRSPASTSATSRR